MELTVPTTTQRNFTDGDRLELPSGEIVTVSIRLQTFPPQKKSFLACEVVEAFALVKLVPLEMLGDGHFYVVCKNGNMQQVSLDIDGTESKPFGPMESTALNVNDLQPIAKGGDV